MRKLDWAMCLYDFGFNPIPVNGKVPAIRWKGIGLDNRRPTLQELEQWFSGEDRNIACLTGKFHGLVVVDADNEEAGQYIELNCTQTPMIVETSKGRHYYYRHPGPKVSSKARVIDDPPVDVRGDGGIITAPGSIHQSGKRYMLLEGLDIVSVRSLPLYQLSWFPEKPVEIPVNKGYNSKIDRNIRAASYLGKIPGAMNGSRNQQAFRAAASIIRDFGIQFEDGLAMMQTWNETKLDPPLSFAEIKCIVSSAMANGKHPVGAKL